MVSAYRKADWAYAHVPWRNMDVHRADRQHLQCFAGVTMATFCVNVRGDFPDSRLVGDRNMGSRGNVALGVPWVCSAFETNVGTPLQHETKTKF